MFEQVRDRPWEFCLGILAVAGVFLAVPLARPDLETVLELPQALYVTFAVVGAVLAVVGLAATILLGIRTLLAHESIWYEFRPVTRRNARAVHEIMRTAFGDEAPSVARILEWQRRNKGVMTAVYRKTLGGGHVRSELAGVFKLVPLTSDAVTKVECEQLTGASLSSTAVATSMHATAGLYIGDVLATTARAKADVLRQLIRVTQTYAAAGVPLYARPLTSDGTRLVRKYGFQPVAPELPTGSIGRIHRRSNDQPSPTAPPNER